MASELMTFENETFGSIRTMNIDGEPWFVAVDVCNALEISNSRDAVARLDDDEKNTVALTDGIRGNPNKVIVNEPGLYSLVLGSRKPEAKAFKRWITHEVIPSIRKHGAYMTPDTLDRMISSPEFGIKLLTALQEERERNAKLENKVEADKPKVMFADAVSTSKSTILVGELAKLLRQNGVDVGQNRLFKWMRENGYLISRNGTDFNMPTQRAMEQGLFTIKETVITHSDGSVSISKTTKVTGKGQQFFVNKFLGE